VAVAYLILVRVHSHTMKTMLIALLAIFVSQSVPIFAKTPVVPVSADRADRLATIYRLRYLSACGGGGHPVLRGDHWEVPITLGRAGQAAGSIHVDTATGVVSYSWHFHSQPTAYPKDLVAWEDALRKGHGAP
jgi:hypothetical protein